MTDYTNIKYIVLGIQYNPNFALLDKWGYIADSTLESKYFGRSFFPNISSNYTTERNLYNPYTGNIFSMSSSNITFKYYIRDHAKFSQEYKEFTSRVKCYIEPFILRNNKLEYRRIGFVVATKIDDKIENQIKQDYFKDEVNGITDFRIAKKDIIRESEIWKGKDDYVNKILTVGRIQDILTPQEQENEVELAPKGLVYDYQLYLNPLQTDLRERLLPFIEGAFSGFKADILRM